MNWNKDQLKDIAETITKYQKVANQEELQREEKRKQKLIEFLKAGESNKQQVKSLW
jgi:hypothetical protein